MKTTIELIQLLVEKGGAIVSSNDCSTFEISDAQATGRFAADEDGYGYVWRYPEWLRNAMALVAEHAKAETTSARAAQVEPDAMARRIANVLRKAGCAPTQFSTRQQGTEHVVSLIAPLLAPQPEDRK